MTVKLYAFTCGTVTGEFAHLMEGGEGDITVPIPVFLVEHPKGRALFGQHCATCHRLFGEGGQIGPELTGSQRANLDYVLENVLDPSAVVPADYQVTILQTKDGRVITGIIKTETDKVVSVQTQNELLQLPRNEIDERQKSPLSMMPEGLLATLKDEEVRDLVAYLASPEQVVLPKDGKTAQGKDR